MTHDGSTYAQVMLSVAQVFEAIAAATLLAGLFWAAGLSWRRYRQTRSGKETYRTMREGFGGAILLGLEILVAGDLIRTVAVAPTLDNAITLAIIVGIRTVLSFSISIEIDGVVPWRKALVSGATVMKQAGSRAQRASDPQTGAPASE